MIRKLYGNAIFLNHIKVLSYLAIAYYKRENLIKKIFIYLLFYY